MKSRLLGFATAAILGLNLQCSHSAHKADETEGNNSGAQTRIAQPEDNLELKLRYQAMEKEIESASKKLAIENLKAIRGIKEIRVWVGFGVTQPRLFVMRLSDGREASFHTARTSRLGDAEVLDVPEKTTLDPPKSGWEDFENFLKAQGIVPQLRLAQESSHYLRSPDVQVVAIEATFGDSYSLIFYHVDNPSDEAQKLLNICHRIERDFEINMYCSAP